MRWNERIREPKYNVPYKTTFLFIPKCLEGQYRWLEMADIEVQWREVGIKSDGSGYLIDEEIRFLNKNKILKDLYLKYKDKLNIFKRKK